MYLCIYVLIHIFIYICIYIYIYYCIIRHMQLIHDTSQDYPVTGSPPLRCKGHVDEIIVTRA